MRLYLGIVSRRSGVPVDPELARTARTLVTHAIPVPRDALSNDEWISPNRMVTLLGWSNEPEHQLLPPVFAGAAADRALGYCGYLADAADALELLKRDSLAGADTLGGVFSLFRASDDGLQAATSTARVCPVYYATGPDVTVIGSRALLVHLVARAAEGKPAPDIDAASLVPLVHHGFLTTDATPFTGVMALPAASVIDARPAATPAISTATLPAAEGAIGQVSELTSALALAVAPLGKSDLPARLALSGGRDSRLLAAALHAGGIPFNAYTHGFDDAPDMILGRQIADLLGIPHDARVTVPEPVKRTVTVPHPLSRATQVIRMCEGMTTGYESVGGYAPFDAVPATSGSGGETLRGGFLYDQQDVSPEGLRRRVNTIFHVADWLLTQDAKDGFKGAAAPWSEMDGFSALDLIYLHYRTGRWIVGSHTATLMNGLYFHPFFDNRVVRAALRLPPRWRHTEEPFYQAIAALAPPLAALPTEGKRWRFEAKRPARLTDWRDWRRRAPVVPRGQTSGFNWRLCTHESLLGILTAQILDGPSALFDIVDRTEMEKLLDRLKSQAPRQAGWMKQVWHVYTMSVLLSGTWYGDSTSSTPDPISVPVT
jgi:asparagine synthetase B (glutamine-hydrolysing)